MAQLPSDATVDAYIAQRAAMLGINPANAVAVSHAERQQRSGGWIGDAGSSFGPFQLHVGGIASGGNGGSGLGDVFRQRTGLDPTNISGTWQQQVDFSLQWIKEHGWGDFHAAKNLGLDNWDGIVQSIGNTVNTTLRYFFPLVGYTGNPKSTYHTPGATDLFAAKGTPIRAIIEGRVTEATTNDPYGGNAVVIHGDDGLDYYYAHMEDAPTVSAGDFVTSGQRIGLVGNSGNASNTAPHLHLGIGHGISTGAGATGGAGIGFDAQSFLSNLLTDGGALPDIGGVIGDSANTAMNIGGSVQSGLTGAFKDFQQGIQNYVQDRAASIVLSVLGVFLILFGIWGFVNQQPQLKAIFKTGVGVAGGAPGAIAAAVL